MPRPGFPVEVSALAFGEVDESAAFEIESPSGFAFESVEMRSRVLLLTSAAVLLLLVGGPPFCEPAEEPVRLFDVEVEEPAFEDGAAASGVRREEGFAACSCESARVTVDLRPGHLAA